MADVSDSIILELTDGIAYVTLNRPRQRNALTQEMVSELSGVLKRVEANSQARVLVVRGAGDHFMAGGDVGGFEQALGMAREARSAHFEQLVQSFSPVIFTLRRMPQPVIASVRGVAAGLGVSMILAADLAIASEGASFVPAYVRLGTTPDGGLTYFLPRVVGFKQATEIVLFGDRFGARRAMSLGIVNAVVGETDLDRETHSWASRLARGASGAIASAKRLLEASRTNSLPAQLQAEAESFARRALTEEFEEGVNAFVQKRNPEFDK